MKDIKALIEVPRGSEGSFWITEVKFKQSNEHKVVREISLSEYMVGFSEWCMENYSKHKGIYLEISVDDHYKEYSIDQLLVIYLETKGVIIK